MTNLSLYNTLDHSRNRFRKAYVLQRLRVWLQRIKFALKKSNGIALTIGYAGLFCGKLSVTGWALSEKGREGIAYIEVYLDHIFLGHARYGHARDDIALAYPFIRNSGQSGFYFHTDLTGLIAAEPDAHHLLIIAIGIDGRRRQKFRLVVNQYNLWLTRHEPNQQQLERQRQVTFPVEPTISILTFTENTPKPFLVEMIESVRHQTYAQWELCISGSAHDHGLKEILDTYAPQECRLKVKLVHEDQGLVENPNEALSLATGDFIGFLDPEDLLAPFALFEVVTCLNVQPATDYLYSDEDQIAENGKKRFDPHFKPDWSPDMLRSTNYPAHFSVVRRTLLKQINGFRKGFERNRDYDLILRITEHTSSIVHIPKILYHRRQSNTSLAHDMASTHAASTLMKKALQDHLERVNLPGTIEDTGASGYYKVTYVLKQTPQVSIIIPNHDQADDLRRCVNSILNKSNYPHVEILIIENGSREAKTLCLYRELAQRNQIRIIEWSQPFNYATVNNFGVTSARGAVLLFLNNDVEVINADWLERMLEHVLRKEVGAVGAKLYYPDDTIQHAGVIIGLGSVAGHCFKAFPRQASGYMGRLQMIQNFSAVTAACLMVREEVFQEAGGFDERYQLAFNDADLCLKIRQKGYLIVWTPYAELYHYESKTRGSDENLEKQARFEQENALFQQKWKTILAQGDPYYNPNLTLVREDFSLRIE